MSASNNNKPSTQGPKGLKAKVRASNTVQVRERAPGYSSDVCNYIQALVDPYGSDPTPVPSPVPYRRTTVKEVKQLDLKDFYVPGVAGGSCFIEIIPDINNTITISANVVTSENTGGLLGTISGQVFHNDDSEPGDGAISQGCVQPMHSYQGRSAFQLTTLGTRTYTIRWNVVNAQPSLSQFSVVTSVYHAGAWTNLGTSTNIFSGNPVESNFTLPANTEAMSFETGLVNGSNGDSATYKLGFTLKNIQAPGIGCPNVVNQMTRFSMTLEDKVEDLESYGVCAMAALVTYEGSDLANGGKIFSAMVPVDWQPQADLTQAMSVLAYDQYDGPLKHGTHLHWFPSSLEEMSLTRAGVPHPISKKMVILVLADDVTQSTRLRLTQHQQYYSQSPAYGAMLYGPTAWSLSPGLTWLAMNIPIATSNDNHLLKKMLEKTKTAAKHGLRYALANPDKIAEFASMLLAL